MGKKKKLMDIGRPRHDEFEMLLRRRFKDRADLKPIVNRIEKQGIDAEVQEKKKGKQSLEVYELTNYDLFHFPTVDTIKAIKKKQQAAIQTKLSSFKTGKKPKKLCYTSPIIPSDLSPLMSSSIFPNRTMYYYMNIKVGKENMNRQIGNLKKYPKAKKYVIVSYGENLTDKALWEYAKEGIRVKIMGYQAQQWHFNVKMKQQLDKYGYCPTCGYKLNSQWVCDECGFSVEEEEKELEKELERFEESLRELAEEIQDDQEQSELWSE
jgi:transcription elongation factor Elf1